MRCKARIQQITSAQWFRFLFPKPTVIIIALLLLTIFSGKDQFWYWLGSMLATFVIFILPLDAILWEKSGRKKFYVDKLSFHLKQAASYADYANKSTDQQKFDFAYEMIVKHLTEAQKYEITGVSLATPVREQLANIQKNKPLYEAKLRERMGDDFSDLQCINYDTMEGHDFEYFCANVLRANGFTDVKVTQGSGDQGVDVLARKDGIKYAIQCKCYSGSIGNAAVQEALAGKAYYDCHVAAVMTNRYFTTSAQDLAEKSGVLLWNRDKLNLFISNM